MHRFHSTVACLAAGGQGPAGGHPYKTAARQNAQARQAAAAAASTVQAAHQDAAAGSQEAAEGSQPGSSQGLDAADGEHAEPASQPAAETAEGW